MSVHTFDHVTIGGVSIPFVSARYDELALMLLAPSRPAPIQSAYRFTVTLPLPEYDALIAFAYTLPKDTEAA